MTEEIEAHVLKKYEILQKLGNEAYHNLLCFNRKGSLWYRVESNRQKDKGYRGSQKELRCILKCN